jgi:hypothetical protein
MTSHSGLDESSAAQDVDDDEDKTSHNMKRAVDDEDEAEPNMKRKRARLCE